MNAQQLYVIVALLAFAGFFTVVRYLLIFFFLFSFNNMNFKFKNYRLMHFAGVDVVVISGLHLKVDGAVGVALVGFLVKLSQNFVIALVVSEVAVSVKIY